MKSNYGAALFVRSDALLADSFAEFWHGKWPHQTRDVKRLEQSMHYVHCRDAWNAGALAMKRERDAAQQALREAIDELAARNQGYWDLDKYDRWMKAAGRRTANASIERPMKPQKEE